MSAALQCATALLAWAAGLAPDAIAVELEPVTEAAFDAYMGSAEARIQKQNREGPFLWIDKSPERKREVQQGKAVAAPWAGNGDIGVEGGLIHDWIGAVFIPGVTLEKTLALVQDYDNHERIYKPEVVDSKMIHHEGGEFKVYMRLLKKKVLTVVLNTNHDVRYIPLDARRYFSRSYSTRIAELENAGEADERELPPGTGHGFLWRLNSFWRFAERDGGVYVECEAISLSRGVPRVVAFLINPIIRSLPKESLVNTLTATRNALVSAP